MWPFKRKPTPAAKATALPATINRPEPVERIRGRIERLKLAIGNLGDGARRQELEKELVRRQRELRQIEAAEQVE